MAFIHGTVVDPSNAGTPDGASAVVNIGRANDLIISELHGKYFQQTYRGNVFYGSTATGGVVIPISTTGGSTCTPTYSLWNPAGSGKLCVPLTMLMTWTATAAALGGYVWMANTNAGNAIGATATFSAFGTGTPVNANLLSGKNSQMRLASGGTTTIVTTPTFYRSTGMSTGVTTAATALGFVTLRDDWDGTGIIPPGNAISLFGTTAVATTVEITLAWAEIPL